MKIDSKKLGENWERFFKRKVSFTNDVDFHFSDVVCIEITRAGKDQVEVRPILPKLELRGIFSSKLSLPSSRRPSISTKCSLSEIIKQIEDKDLKKELFFKML